MLNRPKTLGIGVKRFEIEPKIFEFGAKRCSIGQKRLELEQKGSKSNQKPSNSEQKGAQSGLFNKLCRGNLRNVEKRILMGYLAIAR